MEHIFRVFDFNVYNESPSNDSGSEDNKKNRKDNAEFLIQMFGLSEKGET
jgi:hypothetical protein